MHEEFEIAFSAGEAAGSVREDGEAGGFGGGADAVDGEAMESGIADNAAAADGGAIEFELRLDEQDKLGARISEGDESGYHFCEADEGEIGGDELDRFRQIGGDEMACVFFDGDDARVLAELPGELARGDVDGIDARGAAPEQAIRESASGAADVEANEPCGIDGKIVESAGEFFASAAGKGERVGDEIDGGVNGDEGAGFGCGLARDADAGGEDQGLGALAGFGEAAFDEEEVEAALEGFGFAGWGHRQMRTTKR